MTALHAKLALLLGAAFLAIGGMLVIMTQPMIDRGHLAELSLYVAAAAVAFAIVAALGVFELVTRRLKRLADAVEAVAEGGFKAPLRDVDADRGGDEIDQLALRVQGMSERIVDQLAELDRSAARRRDLLANVSHDLRTPLASMQGYLELLLLRHGSLDAAEERSYLETAVRQGERLGRLVGDLFELTSLETPDARLQAEDFSLAELAQDMVQKFDLDAHRRQVALRAVGCDAGAALRVRADIGMVERVLENLLDNALRHTPAGGEVAIELEPAGGRRAQLRVRDSGSGIAADRIADLFDRYERGDRSAPGAQGGLGLAIARRIVRLHGGELSVRSRPGAGSCFAFDLPLAPRPDAAAAAATAQQGTRR